MRLLDVTLKDLLQSSRSYMVYVFAFVIPILVTLLFMLIFGGLGGGEDFELPNTTVVMVNLDKGNLPAGSEGRATSFEDLNLELPGEADLELGTAGSFGDVLVALMKSDVFADFLSVSEAATEDAGRTAVNDGEAGVAITIPSNFTEAMVQGEETADVQIYKDPTLQLGPQIVESIVRQVLDNFAAGTIATGVAINGLMESGVTLDSALMADILDQVTSGAASGPGGQPLQLVETRLPPGFDESSNIVNEIISLIMGGMMIFFVFFTAAASIETILTEEERGTLQRLFTTPASQRAILGGKVLAGLITVAVQITVLMLFGRFIFGIDWGALAPVVLAIIGVVLAASGMGLFLVSLMQNTRQGGIIFGGALTVTGMMGLIPVFTSGVPNQPQSLETISLLVPQGWAMRSLEIAHESGSIADILPIVAGLVAWALVLGFIGQYRLQRRFA
ncbi:MAG: ABC transporter permease [Chloroflexota bacterium]|jgi:ABC-2 type transport system permease protein